MDGRWIAGGLAAALIGTIGCASNGDMGALRQEVADARATAEEAKRAAEAAAADAAAARASAEAASAEARAASEKADRIFQRSLHK
jgi:hypothetical protein